MHRYLKAFMNPVVQINVLTVGCLLIVGILHNHAHYSMEVDADSYVRNWCKQNPDKCARFIDDDY